MVFPGLKKLAKELDFKNNGTVFYGFLKNSYLIFADGNNQKNLWFRFPVTLSEEDKNRILSWQKKGYAKTIEFFDDDAFDVKFKFVEYFVPFKCSKIKEIIDDVTTYISEKYPDAKVKCCGENCSAEAGVQVFDVSGVPLPMCSDCAKRLEAQIEVAYEEEQLLPNNYIRGTLLALVCCIPGILVSLIFFMGGKLSAIAGLLYYFLALKGYLWAKGKYNKVGIVITAIISLVYTAFGTYVSYFLSIAWQLHKYPDAADIKAFELIRYSFSLVYDPEIKHELLQNIYISLILCSVCIGFEVYKGFKNTNKAKVKKM